MIYRFKVADLREAQGELLIILETIWEKMDKLTTKNDDKFNVSQDISTVGDRSSTSKSDDKVKEGQQEKFRELEEIYEKINYFYKLFCDMIAEVEKSSIADHEVFTYDTEEFDKYIDQVLEKVSTAINSLELTDIFLRVEKETFSELDDPWQFSQATQMDEYHADALFFADYKSMKRVKEQLEFLQDTLKRAYDLEDIKEDLKKDFANLTDINAFEKMLSDKVVTYTEDERKNRDLEFEIGAKFTRGELDKFSEYLKDMFPYLTDREIEELMLLIIADMIYNFGNAEGEFNSIFNSLFGISWSDWYNKYSEELEQIKNSGDFYNKFKKMIENDHSKESNFDSDNELIDFAHFSATLTTLLNNDFPLYDEIIDQGSGWGGDYLSVYDTRDINSDYLAIIVYSDMQRGMSFIESYNKRLDELKKDPLQNWEEFFERSEGQIIGKELVELLKYLRDQLLGGK